MSPLVSYQDVPSSLTPSSLPTAQRRALGPTDLPEPGALQKEGAGPEGLQDDVVSEEHLQEGTEGSSKDSHGQQGVEVLVQRNIAVVMETEEQACQDSHCIRDLSVFF